MLPILPTCGERTIDFFVVSTCLEQAVLKAVAVGDSLCSPHSAVRLYIKAAPRQIMVRQLKSCATIGVDMPYGPARWRENYVPMAVDATVDQWYDSFLNRVEAETVDLYPLPENQTKKFFGRTAGPTFVHRSALNDENAGSRKTSSVSRAWRRTAKWLNDILVAKGVSRMMFAVKNVFHYSHPPRLGVLLPRSSSPALKLSKCGGG